MQSMRGVSTAVGDGVFLTLPALHGCTQLQSHDTLVSPLSRIEPRLSPAAQPTKPKQEPNTVPREIDHTTLLFSKNLNRRTVPRELSHVTLPPH